MISDEAIITRSTSVLFSLADGAVVMMDIESGSYHDLDETGSAIWLMLDQPRAFGAICAALLEEFDIDAAQCRADTEDFILGLQQRGLVAIA